MTAALSARPTVADLDASDDSSWFADHPQRCYRLRLDPRAGAWFVRRRGRAPAAFLRVYVAIVPRGLGDSGDSLRAAWFFSAYPTLDRKITFEPMPGAGEQVGWPHAADLKSDPGLSVRYFPIFRSPTTGNITIGMPLALGAAPGSRSSAITFDTDEHRARFLERLKAALRGAAPGLFEGERATP